MLKETSEATVKWLDFAHTHQSVTNGGFHKSLSLSGWTWKHSTSSQSTLSSFLLTEYNWQINQSSPQHSFAVLSLHKGHCPFFFPGMAGTGKFHRLLSKFKVAIVSDKVSPDIVILKQCNNMSLNCVTPATACFLPLHSSSGQWTSHPTIHCLNNTHSCFIKFYWNGFNWNFSSSQTVALLDECI